MTEEAVDLLPGARDDNANVVPLSTLCGRHWTHATQMRATTTASDTSHSPAAQLSPRHAGPATAIRELAASDA